MEASQRVVPAVSLFRLRLGAFRRAWLLGLLVTLSTAWGSSLTINSLSGPVSSSEINSFISYMQSQAPPPTPWGPLTGTGHNEWADGTGGRDLEAMGEMYEISSNLTILNLMISWADDCASQRNDLMSAANGGQRVLWTGLIDKVWCPNWPTDATDGQSNYCGCETEDVIGHMAFCAKLILQTPSLWNVTVPDGNPYGYGVTYLQRATNYLATGDAANDEYFLKWFIQPGTDLIVPPTNAVWTALNENVTANNRQMMFTSGFQRLAEAHELLGDNPARVAQYDAIVQATINQDLTGMIHFHPYTTNGQAVYDWGYYPTTDGPEATEIHAEYDIIGVWRAFNRSKYAITLAPLVPFANTLLNVIYLGTNTFAGNVDGSGGVQSPIYSGWMLTADWNPAVYTLVAGTSYTNGWYTGSPDIDADILWMKNRRYLQFSVTPTAPVQTTLPGSAAMFPVTIAPLAGFTNAVGLTVTGLPIGATGSFNSPMVNLATLNSVSTNVTLTISTTAAIPAGTYPITIIATNGSVAHTNSVSLIVGTFALSTTLSSQTVSAGNSVSYPINLTTNTGFTGTVSFGVSGLPTGASASFTPNSLTSAGSATLNVSTITSTPGGSYTLTINGTNGTTVISTTVNLVVVGANPVWTGGSAVDSNWSDATNWGGLSLLAGNELNFSGSVRLNNMNNTAAGTTYSNVVFYPGAGSFVLTGNPINLGGNITNNSANVQTLALGLNFNNSFTFNGASNTLIIGGDLTNTVSGAGWTTLTLAGSGLFTNLWHNTSSAGGTNILVLNNNSDNWTLLNNAASTASTVPWAFNINGGTFNYGANGSAPILNLTTPNSTPSDNLVGSGSGLTGTYNVINGTLTSAGRWDTATALNSTGIVNQAGGTFNMGSQFQGANGSYLGEVSFVNLSGGTMNISGGSGPFYVASRGSGTLTVSGAAVLNCGTLDLSRNAAGNTFGSVGVVNLNGGTILCSHVGTATANAQTNWTTGPSAIFNFNGGTLKLNSSTSPFFQGSTVAPVIPIQAVVSSGGAVIDSNGNTNTFGEALVHDSNLGSVADGGLTKNGTGTLILVSNVTYTGSTVINAGTLALSNSVSLSTSPLLDVSAGAMLDASGRTGGTLTLTNGQTLTGAGTVKGNTIVGSGATLAPGGSLTTLTFSNSLILNNGSTTVMELSQLPLTNDAVRVTGAVFYGGTLVLTNVNATALASGASFKLFSAGSYSGAFTNITPAIPGLNLAWNTNSLSSGVISVVAGPTPRPQISALQINGGNVIIGGTNGVPNWPYYLVASTNLALPLSNWTIVSTNAFDGNGNFNLTNLSGIGTAQNFYLLKLP